MKSADKLAGLAEGDEELEEEHGNFLICSLIFCSGSSAAAAAELERALVFPLPFLLGRAVRTKEAKH